VHVSARRAVDVDKCRITPCGKFQRQLEFNFSACELTKRNLAVQRESENKIMKRKKKDKKKKN
jgi:hypothetical protein